MKRLTYIATLICTIALATLLIFFFRPSPEQMPEESVLRDAEPIPEEITPQPVALIVPELVDLPVPYISETPDGVWTGSWKNGCEEAAIAMVEKFYAGYTQVGKEDAKAFMQTLFDWQNAQYGEDANSDAERMLAIMQANSSFNVELVRNPTIEAIKAELDAGRPVIAIHRGFDLQNKNIPFIPTASSYHATTIKGYDDKRQEFIVHDTGDTKTGADHRYDYNLYMNSLHDYVVATDTADGPPTVFFTAPK